MKQSDQTVFILGAGPGLSSGLARVFGSDGATVVLFSRSERHLSELSKPLIDEGISVRTMTADCSNAVELKTALLKAQEQFGVPNLVVYNTCNISPDTAQNLDASAWPNRFAGDVAGALAAVQAVAGDEFAAKNGAVIFTGGTAGIDGLPGYLSLSVDKAALRMLAKCLNQEYAARGVFIGVVQIEPVIAWGSEKGDPLRIAKAFKQFAESKESWEIIYRG